MKGFAIVAALLLCSNASAATYVYQGNAYTTTQGRCRGALVPMQATITMANVLPANTTTDTPLETVALSAGVYPFELRATKKKPLSGIFTTDVNGNLVEWNTNGVKSKRLYYFTHNLLPGGGGNTQDVVAVKCASGVVQNNPGTWTRTE